MFLKLKIFFLLLHIPKAQIPKGSTFFIKKENFFHSALLSCPGTVLIMTCILSLFLFWYFLKILNVLPFIKLYLAFHTTTGPPMITEFWTISLIQNLFYSFVVFRFLISKYLQGNPQVELSGGWVGVQTNICGKFGRLWFHPTT